MNAILNEKSETDSCQYFCFGLSFSNSPLSSYSFRTCSILRIQRSSISTFSAYDLKFITTASTSSMI